MQFSLNYISNETLLSALWGNNFCKNVTFQNHVEMCNIFLGVTQNDEIINNNNKIGILIFRSKHLHSFSY